MAGYKFNPLEGTFDLVGSGVSGGSYTFDNGLTDDLGVVKLGGEVALGTSLSVLDTNLLFDSYDIGPLVGFPLSVSNMAMSRETTLGLGSGDMLLKHKIGLGIDYNGLMIPGVSIEAGLGPDPSAENPEPMASQLSRVLSDFDGRSMTMETVFKADSTQETPSAHSLVSTYGDATTLEYTTEEYGHRSIRLGQNGIRFRYGSDAIGAVYKEGRFTNVADPVAPQDVATKKYVDDNAGGGGGQSYQFQNGLTEEDGTVKLGGEVEDGTALTLGNSGLTFHEVDMEPLIGEAGVAYGASLDTELDVPGFKIKSGVGTVADFGGIKFPLASIYATYRGEDDTETIVSTGPLNGGIGVGSILQDADGAVYGSEQFTADRWSVHITDNRGEDQKGFGIAAAHGGFQFGYGNHTLFFQNGRIEGLEDGIEPDHAVNKSQLDTKQDALPTPPSTGTFVLKSVDGVLEWVAEE